MTNDPRVRNLLERLLATGQSPESVCAESPDLLSEVRERWRELSRLDAVIAELFPGDDAAPTRVPVTPAIPGYSIDGILGTGGMGVVYRARHLRLDRPVALKMLLGGAYAGPVALARFDREARTVAALQHPNIVQVFDVGAFEGWPYFTMEYMDGGTLANAVASRPQDVRSAATLVATIADAVESAHRCGVIHRDLKPANVLLTAAGTPKISDFGLAHRTDESSLTQSGARMGTPTYMAPEQALGKREAIGPQTDIYGLGVILYQLIAGRPPFEAPTPGELHRRVVHEPPAPPSRRNRRVPRDLETICLRCLHKDPARRYPSAGELAADLQRFLRHEPILARPVGLAERSIGWCRRKPALAGLVITGVALLGLTIASLLREMSLAAARRTELANLELELEEVIRLGGEGRLTAARVKLDGLADGGSENLRQRIAGTRGGLELAEQLEEIRLQRSVLGDDRFATNVNKTLAEAQYRTAFAAASLGSVDEPAADVAARIAPSWVRKSLVAALDDWALCAADDKLRSWLLDVAQRADPSAPEWLRRLRDPAAWRDPDALMELATSAPDSQPVTLLLGVAARLREAGKGGTVFLERMVLRHAGDFWVNLALAEAVFWQDRMAAVRYYQAAVALRPSGAIPRADLARALANVGRNEEALDQLRIAIELEPDLAMAHCWLGNVLSQTGRRDEAIAAYRTAIRLAPGQWQPHSNLGVALAETGHLDDAVAEYREALRIRPDAGETHSNLGNALGALGRVDEAIAQYRLGVAAAPELVCTNYGLGFALWNVGRFDEAAGYLRKAIQIDPTHRFSHLHLAECLKDRGRVREAIPVYQQCLALKVGDERPHLVLRRMQFLQQGRGEDARAAWQKWLEGVPREHCLWEGYAELCAFLGHVEEYERACNVLATSVGDGDDVRAAGRAGFAGALLPRTEQDVRRAIEQVERAVAADESKYESWERPWFLFAKGLLFYRSGRFDEALALLSVGPVTDIGVAPKLVAAMAHHRLGRTSEARESLGAAVASEDWSAMRAIHRDIWVEHVLRREAEALVVPDLAALIAGQREPRDQHERLVLLGACEFEGRHLMTARLYADAFTADPTLADANSGDPLRRAARAAAFAGAGRGTGASTLGDGDMAALRSQARAWLRQCLAVWRSALDRDLAGNREAASRALGAWQNEPGFAALRAPSTGESPSAERDDCRSLWSEVEELLARAAAK